MNYMGIQDKTSCFLMQACNSLKTGIQAKAKN